MGNETHQTNANVLFRGKRVDTAQWVYGWYCEEAFGRWPLKPCIIPSNLARDGELMHEQIILITLGQYTGLVDKNSVRVFAGDILEWKLYLSNSVDTAKAVVEFKNGKFIAAGEDLAVLINSHDAVVVGNIYDETTDSDLYSKARSTVEHWPEWKREIYNQSIAVSKHARKIEPVEYVPLVYGEWIPVPSSDLSTGRAYKCSNCSKMRYGSYLPPYCQCCGSKIRTLSKDEGSEVS